MSIPWGDIFGWLVALAAIAIVAGGGSNRSAKSRR